MVFWGKKQKNLLISSIILHFFRVPFLSYLAVFIVPLKFGVSFLVFYTKMSSRVKKIESWLRYGIIKNIFGDIYKKIKTNKLQ